MKIKARDIEMVEIGAIVENPKNANRHSVEQIKRLEELIKFQGFRNPLVISNRTGYLLAGHGRLEAARNLGMTKLPVTRQDFESEAQEYAYLVSDNEIARWAELDLQAVYEDIKDLPELEVDMLGIEDFSLPKIDEADEESYTRKVESPIYEPTGAKPTIGQLYNRDKTADLIAEIDDTNLPSEMKLFLYAAAARHTQFNYKMIAEYYAHASHLEQKLFEKSALIIIDFEKAIENGFVKLTEKNRQAYINEK